MANHGFITSKKNFKKEQVIKDLQEINLRRFDRKLTISSDFDTEWFISHGGYGFYIWISSPRKLEHRHASGWLYYLELVFAEEMGKKYNAIMSDEGSDEKWKPRPEKYPTFKSWLDILYGHSKIKHPESYKTMIDLEMETCPRGFKKY